MRQLLYRGRHHVHTAPRPADGGLVTVSMVAAKMRREALLRALFGQVASVDECAVRHELMRHELQRHYGIGA